MENVKNIAVELRKCQREKYHHLLQRVGSLEESGAASREVRKKGSCNETIKQQ